MRQMTLTTLIPGKHPQIFCNIHYMAHIYMYFHNHRVVELVDGMRDDLEGDFETKLKFDGHIIRGNHSYLDLFLVHNHFTLCSKVLG